MQIKVFVVILMIMFPLFLNAQEKKEEEKFGISFSGFVKTDLFYDSRQTVNIREGHFLLYPENQKLDLNGIDINAKDHFGILSIQSRLTGKITGPDVLKAKTSALLEADFFGNENLNFSDVNGFRIRHAIIKLNWQTTELLIGQYWHPLFVPECFPDVVSFNTGSPFQPFSRNPQIRLTQKVNKIKLIVAATSQRDFSSTGPDGVSPKYLSNAVLPDMNLHLLYSSLFNETNEFLLGAGAEFKQLVPRLYSQGDKNLKDGRDSIYFAGDERVSSYALSVYSKLKLKTVTIKAYAIYGRNLYDQVMLGGYAVTSLNESNQMSYEYSPVKNISLWTELSTSGKVQAGIFAGYTKNLGTENDNTGVYYSRGSNINYVYRIAPRMIINLEKLRIAAELEFTSAQYGKANTAGLVDSDLKTFSNLRLLTAFYYFF
jgi:hypothetical protein